MSDETVVYETGEGIATVTLNRPEHLNSWNAQLDAELGDALAEADGDDSVRAVIVTGAGRAFCAGADLSGGQFGGGPSAPKLRKLWPYELRKPVIAAINGAAVGVGITYPMLCDIRIAAETAKIQFAFVRRGALPELASHAIVPRVCGFSVAADLLLSGRTISGTEAAALGLVSQAVPADQVVATARAIAADIATNTAPISVAVSKRLLWQAMTQTVDESRAAENAVFGKITASADTKEAITAFFERRTPTFTGRPSVELPQGVY
ncbi:MAG: enoyl-CoA hydratase-related protein [Ilumatobacteraceae bacterium]